VPSSSLGQSAPAENIVPPSGGIPDWLPDLAVTYLAHTSGGLGIRALARAKGCHASTVLRQVRKVEAWRDDPLVDEALDRMGRVFAAGAHGYDLTEVTADMPTPAPTPLRPDGRAEFRRDQGGEPRSGARPDARIEREARRILRRLCEKGAFLAVAPAWKRRSCCARWCPASRTASPSSIGTWRMPLHSRSGSPASAPERSRSTASPRSVGRR
jgi:hypothetical protein